MQPPENEPEINSHPTEPLLEAILEQTAKNNNEPLLESILEQTAKNNADGLLEAQLEKTDEVVKSVKDLTNKLEPQELGDGKTFVVKGVKGDKGDKGDSIKGDKGDKGEQGIKGEKGDKGEQGIEGKSGKDGTNGRDGLDGKDGLKGDKGDKGEPGKDGKDVPKEIKEKLESLKGENRLDVSAIKGIKKIEDSITRLASARSTYIGGDTINGVSEAPIDGKQYARKDANWNEVVITDEKVKISASDTTAGYLEDKLIAGSNVTLTKEGIGADETIKVSTIGLSGGGYAANIYFTTEDSDVTGYKKISYINELTETELTGTISNGEYLFRTYLYDDAIVTDLIDAGIWRANVRVKISSKAGDTQLKFEPFLRHTDDTETTLFTEYSDILENTDYETISISVNKPAYNCLATDRFGVRVYAKTTAVANITIYTIVGDGDASYFITPIAIRHNQLRDLVWKNSGHIGDADSFATFDSSGNPTSTPIVSFTKIRRQEWVSPYSYCGLAPYGSLETDSVWSIARIEVLNTGATTVLHAINVKWSDRLTIVYS